MSELKATDIVRKLAEHKDKQFVQRILAKSLFDVLQLPSGEMATHRMAWGEEDGKFYVYPTIVYEQGKLKQLEDKEAWDRAKNTNERIQFNSAIEADDFSKQYKKVWEIK